MDNVELSYVQKADKGLRSTEAIREVEVNDYSFALFLPVVMDLINAAVHKHTGVDEHFRFSQVVPAVSKLAETGVYSNIKAIKSLNMYQGIALYGKDSRHYGKVELNEELFDECVSVVHELRDNVCLYVFGEVLKYRSIHE